MHDMLIPNEAELKETFPIFNFNARSSKKVIDNRLFSNGKFPILCFYSLNNSHCVGTASQCYHDCLEHYFSQAVLVYIYKTAVHRYQPN